MGNNQSMHALLACNWLAPYIASLDCESRHYGMAAANISVDMCVKYPEEGKHLQEADLSQCQQSLLSQPEAI